MILHINVPFSKTEELKPRNKNNEEEENIFVFPSMQMEGIAAENRRHSIYIRTVTSYHMLSALLNWFKLVYGSIEQSNMHYILNFCPDQPGRNRMHQNQIE